MMSTWRQRWHEGTGGATDPTFPFGFVQVGPMGHPGADSFAIRMGQTCDFGYAPNERMTNTFAATAIGMLF